MQIILWIEKILLVFLIGSLLFKIHYSRKYLDQLKNHKKVSFINEIDIPYGKSIGKVIEFSFPINEYDPLNPKWNLIWSMRKENLRVSNRYYEVNKKRFAFKLDNSNYYLFRNEILIPLSKIKEEYFVIHFNEEIIYSISSLEDLSKKLSEQDLIKEIERVIGFIKEISEYANGIEKQASQKVKIYQDEKMKDLLEKHHLAMEQNIKKVQLINKIK
ncbi:MULTISPECIES: hypothetical protein [Niallia]|uniref:Uncharacterized protein n=1 Tax=Niallia circulans TaxID=1397 RepID=A0A941GH18_NIACI|nr:MULTISPECIES: hypothetical protein [Niallia]MCB5237201.1 hypothetical protein [Niallia circulans]MED3795635.1 hypothetical protein [Niallia alba]